MIDYEVAGGCATVRLNRPPVNAINDAWLARFHGILDALEQDPTIRVMLVRSELRSFCAGMDLDRIRELFAHSDGAAEMVADVAEFQRLFARIEDAPFVAVAEIEGHALGGGLELALACDLRIVSSKTKLGLPEAKLGLIPGAGGTQRLTKLCGRGTASRIILSGEIIDGPAAERLGIVQWSVEPERLHDQTAEIVARICTLSGAALREAKGLIAAAGAPDRDGFHEEQEADRRLFSDTDTRGRIASFLAGNR